MSLFCLTIQLVVLLIMIQRAGRLMVVACCSDYIDSSLIVTVIESWLMGIGKYDELCGTTTK